MRGYRLFNYKFISMTFIYALQEKLIQLHQLPGLHEYMGGQIKDELSLYKRLSEHEYTKNVQIEFWLFFKPHQLDLPRTYIEAKRQRASVCSILYCI